eukprot:1157697-Pelagomonas_calceolata.AAC.11
MILRPLSGCHFKPSTHPSAVVSWASLRVGCPGLTRLLIALTLSGCHFKPCTHQTAFCPVPTSVAGCPAPTRVLVALPLSGYHFKPCTHQTAFCPAPTRVAGCPAPTRVLVVVCPSQAATSSPAPTRVLGLRASGNGQAPSGPALDATGNTSPVPGLAGLGVPRQESESGACVMGMSGTGWVLVVFHTCTQVHVRIWSGKNWVGRVFSHPHMWKLLIGFGVGHAATGASRGSWLQTVADWLEWVLARGGGRHKARRLLIHDTGKPWSASIQQCLAGTDC